MANKISNKLCLTKESLSFLPDDLENMSIDDVEEFTTFCKPMVKFVNKNDEKINEYITIGGLIMFSDDEDDERNFLFDITSKNNNVNLFCYDTIVSSIYDKLENKLKIQRNKINMVSFKGCTKKGNSLYFRFRVYM